MFLPMRRSSLGSSAQWKKLPNPGQRFSNARSKFQQDPCTSTNYLCPNGLCSNSWHTLPPKSDDTMENLMKKNTKKIYKNKIFILKKCIKIKFTKFSRHFANFSLFFLLLTILFLSNALKRMTVTTRKCQIYDTGDIFSSYTE